jgi:hypothetical protein
MATRRRNKALQRADSLVLLGELSLAGVAYRISQDRGLELPAGASAKSSFL